VIQSLRPVLRPFFEVLVLAKAALILDGVLRIRKIATKKVLSPFLDLKDLKILILDEA